MKRITKSTPIGTRVIFAYGTAILRGKLVWFNDGAPIIAHDGNNLRPFAESVCVDEPAPGTFGWACETVRQGTNVVSRKLGDGIVKTVALCGDDLVTMLVHGEDADECELDRDDLEATNWELV